ncbi:MAG: phosphoenolpyruvate carboxykinase (GTP) [Clostridia bacterium]|nr:phosphoenolpyruvate carboxykinase (GTP) [Clostridia bacterium]
MDCQNAMVNQFIKEAAELLQPERIVWIDGSEQQTEELRRLGCERGEMIRLNQEKLPNCYYHRTAVNDVSRVEDRTFICSREKKHAGATNNWMEPRRAYALTDGIMRGRMKGRTMYVIPFSMGVVSSPFSKIGIELTDSIYVVLNMLIMTRCGEQVIRALGDSNDFVRGLHALCDIDEQKRYILQFPEDNAIRSCNSGYGGNVLLGKKCFALRIASYQGWKEGWMAEHMLILGLENPAGDVRYIAAAFPSACGKTNLAMLIPPEGYRIKGYRVWTVGDDIAWIRVGPDGRFYAQNPEAGFFGVAPGTNEKSNPNALACTNEGTIFTNVALKPDGTVWWEGLDKNPPRDALDWTGKPWDPDSGVKGAHPNSRFTAPARNCPCISPEWENPAGVPLEAIIFGGRRAKTAPLVYQSRDWDHGVFVGSIMASETTAAATGAVGVPRRDPMSMLPFCGYDMGDYFQHWLDMGKMTTDDKLPKIFNVNWFRLDDKGNFIWPGFGENFRVLQWIIARCLGEVDAVETPIGWVPYPEDIHIEGLDYQICPNHRFGEEDLRRLLTIENSLWLDEVADIRAFYAKIGKTVPAKLIKELNKMEARLREDAKA